MSDVCNIVTTCKHSEFCVTGISVASLTDKIPKSFLKSVT